MVVEKCYTPMVSSVEMQLEVKSTMSTNLIFATCSFITINCNKSQSPRAYSVDGRLFKFL